MPRAAATCRTLCPVVPYPASPFLTKTAVIKRVSDQKPPMISTPIRVWDNLGWKDPLSNPASTDRQKAYARRLSGGQVYTPQIVVEGTREMVGSHREEVLAALRQAEPAASATVNFSADRRSVTIGPGIGAGEVLLARFAQHLATQVGAGENAGRMLDDANGVETLTVLGPWTGATLRFPIEPPEPGKGVAVLVQAADGHI